MLAMKRNIFLIILFSSLFIPSCKEEGFIPDVFGSIFGQVLEEGSNSAIENATVTTNPPTNILQTDALGRFSLEDIKTGNYTLLI